MSKDKELPTSVVAERDDTSKQAPESVQKSGKRDLMPPVKSRFMLVDIASLRAKQLRRGALIRVPVPSKLEGTSDTPVKLKLEGIAIREIEAGLIVYTIPDETEDASASDAPRKVS